MKIFLRQRGFAYLLVLLAITSLLGLAFAVWYLSRNPPQSFQNQKVVSPTPSQTPSSTTGVGIKIMSIYELSNSVFFTTNKAVNAKFYHWLDPKSKTESYLGNGIVFNLNSSSLEKGIGYQIKITDEKGNEVVSDSYVFEGDKTILSDSRCPNLTLDYIENNLNAVCQNSSACVQGPNTETNSCPLDKIKSTIKSANVKAIWTDNKISYSVNKTYLTSDIVDLGDYKNNPGIKGKSFLSVEVNVRDLRTSGAKRAIALENYFRIRRNGKDSAPIPLQPQYISPQENKTLYVLFTTDKGEINFSLLTGLLASPNVVTVDFSNSSALSGTFSYKTGFSSN